jgi:mono/diheme cytochrome c family protein
MARRHESAWRRAQTPAVLALLLAAPAALAQTPAAPPAAAFAPETVKKGSGIFSQNCAACHGARMADPQGAFDLRKFPRDEKSRFLTSVTKGKNGMPPWGDLLQGDEIDALWAYVMAGEK